jgi:RecA-family ATPase
LPYVREADIHRFLDDAGRILAEFGYTPPLGDRSQANGAGDQHTHCDWADVIGHLLKGASLHDSLRDLAASFAASGMNPAQAKRLLEALMLSAPIAHDERWKARFGEIERLVDGAGKFGGATEPASLRIINPADWQDKEVPPRDWIVPDWIPARTVTLLFGDGGAGKTTLALQLAAARAIARDWITTLPTPGRTLVLSAEDDDRELHRRADAIRSHYGVRFSDLTDMRLVDLVGENAILGELNRKGIINATTLFKAVVAEIEQFKPELVIIDALADSFAGDENSRAQARQFIALLKGPARVCGCAFLVLAHPSLSGLSTGRGTSGSTAWSNSVRSRLYFTPAQGSDGSEPDPDLRQLTIAKANYAPTGTTIPLRWQAGVYVPVPGMGSLDRMALEAKADNLFLTLLARFAEQDRNVCDKKGVAYAPALFAREPEAREQGIQKEHFADAMVRLFKAKRIRLERYGPPSRGWHRLVAEA